MKKYIPLVLIIILFCASLIIKQDLMLHNNIMSDEERANNICMQMITLSPITIIGGVILLIYPRVVFR